MDTQRGFAHLILLLFIIIAIAVVGFLLISRKNLKFIGGKKETAVQLKQAYKNPFDKKDQYVNPFDQYKSPLYNLKSK